MTLPLVPPLPPEGDVHWYSHYAGMDALLRALRTAVTNLNGGAPTPKRGTYASRPAASTVKTGTVYYATDTLEQYLALGTDGANATSWWVVPSGGAELNRATRTTTFNVTAGTAWISVPSTSFSIVMPERPVLLTGRAVVKFEDVTADPTIGIFDVTGTATELDQAHPGQSANVEDFGHAYAQAELTGTPGTARTFELRALQRAGVAWSLPAAPTFPITLRAQTT